MVHDEERTEASSSVDRRRTVRLVAMAVLLVLAVIWGVANSQSVDVDFLVTDTRTPLVWVILISMVVGAVLERLYFWVRGRRRD